MNASILKPVILSTVVLSTALLSSAVQATTTAKVDAVTAAKISPAQPVRHMHKQHLLAEKHQKVVDEARDAIIAARKALLDLDKNNSKAALTQLKTASKKLAGYLGKHPDMALAVADVDMQVFEFQGDETQLKSRIKEASDLLAAGKLQDARLIMADLASEMRFTTISVPLGSYPDAFNRAMSSIQAKNPGDAAQILDDTLNTLVEETEIIPIPVLRADGLLMATNAAEHRLDMNNPQNRDEVLKSLDVVKTQLQMGELLGYGGKADYQPLYDVIEELKNNVNTDKAATAWETAKQSLATLKSKIIRKIKR